MRVQGDQLISITCGADSAVSRSNRTVNQLLDNYIAAVDKRIFFFPAFYKYPESTVSVSCSLSDLRREIIRYGEWIKVSAISKAV